MFPGLYKSFDKWTYSLILLTQHDDTVHIKAYQADDTKKVPGLQMSNPG